MKLATASSTVGLAFTVVVTIGFLATNTNAKDLKATEACSIDEYYLQVLPIASASREDLQKLLEDTHLQRLQYTDDGKNDDKDDVWEALRELDRGDEPGTVRLIYSGKDVPYEPKGTGSTWNREHVWPKSRGVGYSGKDFTDIHHLFPADWGINSIRNNRYFDTCTDEEACKIPNELKDMVDPPRYAVGIFQPPPAVRGDVARALFYMDLRYPNLHLTDCPLEKEAKDDDPNDQMAYLSTLLKWHTLDPPTPSERSRNDAACSRWQGNRNPFVDFPNLVDSIYGTASGDKKKNCETISISISTSDSDDEVTLPAPGDVMVSGIHSDNPDQVALVALVDLPQDLVIHLTDNAYHGGKPTAFAKNEGTISLTLPQPVKAGSVFGFGEGLLYGDSWISEWDKGFRLSSSGDTIIVYATTPDWDPNDGHDHSNDVGFLSAVSFAGGTFIEEESCAPESCGTKNSALPMSIAGFVIELNKKDNFLYTGSTNGTKGTIQKKLADENEHWTGSNSKTDETVSIVKWLAENPDGFTILK